MKKMVDCDEDLIRNPFYLHFRKNHGRLYEEAIRNRWILCIPSVQCICTEIQQFDEQYVKQHLIQSEEGCCKTLSDELVSIENGYLRVRGNRLKILFEETLYTEVGKLLALCVCHPENPPPASVKSGNPPHPTSTQQRITKEAIRNAKKLLALDSGFDESRTLMQVTDDLRKILKSLDYKVSTCVVFNLYDHIMELVTTYFRLEDEHLNKIRKNIDGIERFLSESIPAEFVDSSAKALDAFQQIVNMKTSERKLLTLKETVHLLTQTELATELNADKLLSLFVDMITSSEVTNWNAQLYFIRNFNLSEKCQYGEEFYYVSTLEAALLHLKSINLPCSLKKTLKFNAEDACDSIYKLTVEGNAAVLENLLCSANFKCHPLCTCQSCGIPLVVDPTAPDDSGFTILHYACMYGHTDITQVLLQTAFKHKDKIQIRDSNGRTALHWAAFRGFQTCLLLLCHQYLDLNATDRDGNTALHLAVRNGHESCVKALLYYAEHSHFQLDINSRNRNGDGPLHLAAKWGYGNIVHLLLQWGAVRNTLNYRRLTPADVAQNPVLARFIRLYDYPAEVHPSHSFWSTVKKHLTLKDA